MPVSISSPTRLPALAKVEEAPVNTRKSVEWKRKRPPAKNFHIKTFDDKLVCCVPMGEIPPPRRSLLGLHQLPVEPITTSQQSYKPHDTHPNLSKHPTRYSANKNKTYSTLGIVPMTPLWAEMMEKQKTSTRRKSRKSKEKNILPNKPEFPQKAPAPAPGNRGRGSVPGPEPAGGRRSTVNLPKLNAAQLKNMDKAELFMLHSLPSQKWRSHWVGPL